MFAVQADGQSVTTIEGVSRDSESLHPLQEAFARHHGLQCGFCTPGLIMTCLPALSELATMTRQDLRRYLSGNICRCTGYAKILDAVSDAARQAQRPSGETRNADSGDTGGQRVGDPS